MLPRPAFLPDPNDGSLYILGGKNKEGLMVSRAVGLWASCDPLGCRGDCRGDSALHLLCCLCCRSCRSPSRSWCSPRRAAARMECSTPVRRRWGTRRSGSRGGPQAGAQRELLGKAGLRGLTKQAFSFSGKKQDTWFIVDPKSGQKQTTLSTEAWDGLCPSSPLLYIGRTRKPVPWPCRPPGARNGSLEVTSCPAAVPRVHHHHV